MGELISYLGSYTSSLVGALEYLFSIFFNLPIYNFTLGSILIVFIVCGFILWLVANILGVSTRD